MRVFPWCLMRCVVLDFVALGVRGVREGGIPAWGFLGYEMDMVAGRPGTARRRRQLLSFVLYLSIHQTCSLSALNTDAVMASKHARPSSSLA